MDEKLYRELMNQQAEMAKDIFAHPPKDMLEFNVRLGGYRKIQEVMDYMVSQTKKDDDL